ncbi:hypothetical protein BBJ28_00017141 [Nothophytophthora sp. Chile5]|nr:hypothetical protein BBJ28_00017141 [Nothophytophthora sp. Chile5]
MRLAACLVSFAVGMQSVEARADLKSSFPGHLHVNPGVSAGLAIVLGLVICLCGYKLLRPMIFACGFLLSGLLTAMAFESTFGTTTWVLSASWIGFIVVGTAGGCVALALYPLGVFMVGALLVFSLTTSIPYRMVPSEPNVVLDIALGLLGGMLVWLLERPFIIVASSFVGATAAPRGVGHFAGKYPSSSDLEHFRSHEAGIDGAWVYDVPTTWWAYLAATLLLFLVGVVKQCYDVRKVRRNVRIGRYNGWRNSRSMSVA